MARNVRATHNEHLRDPDIAADYLNEDLENEDAAVILMALRNIAEAQEDGISGLAQHCHRGRVPPGPREHVQELVSTTAKALYDPTY